MFPSQAYLKLSKIKKYIESLGFEPRNEELLLTTFIHKSFAKDFKENVPHNERLEFLGDSILGACIADLLYNTYDVEEGRLSLYKISLVKQETLAKAALDIKLNEYIIIGHGEEQTGGRNKESILADSFEALIGYIYLTFGFEKTKDFLNKTLFQLKDKIEIKKSYKNLFQEYIQKKYKNIPIYKDYPYEIDEKGNVLIYKSEVYVDDEKYGEGYGTNKKKAQEEAAKNAYLKVTN